ncbi:MAG: glycosyltransferase family 4 protein [Acidimicrobiales bacterium]
MSLAASVRRLVARPRRGTTASGARLGPPHVLIVVQNLPVPLDRRVWLECKALTAAGRRVSVICPAGDGEPAFERLDGVALHRYRPPRPARGSLGFAREFAYCWLASARLALRIAVRDRVHVLQACNPPDTYFLLALALRGLGARFVFDQHDLCPELYTSRFARPSRPVAAALGLLELASYRCADHVIVVNESFRRVALGRGRLPADRVTVVRSGPPAAMARGEATPALRNGRRHLCCWLGIMGPQDGVDLALRALALLVHERRRYDVQFAFLGFGDCFEELRALADKLGVADHVTFTGRADDETITRWLSTADLGLSPDPRNDMNDLCTMNKTLEYLAFSLPVVCFDLAETRVSAGEAAWYAPPNDVTAFADGIATLLDDPARRAAMGAVGRARIDDALAWEHWAPRYVAVYDRLLGAAAPAARTPETAAPEAASPEAGGHWPSRRTTRSGGPLS